MVSSNPLKKADRKDLAAYVSLSIFTCQRAHLSRHQNKPKLT